MDIYFSPLACSMASRIALYETGRAARLLEVDPRTKTLRHDGSDYRAVHALGLVPALRTDDGELVTENAAILQLLATGPLAPADERERTRLQSWLCFIGTELHKGIFSTLFDPEAPEGAKAHVIRKGASRLAYLERHLTGREFLLDTFSVADAYLVTVLNWTMATPVDLAPYPAVRAYLRRLWQRPSVARAMGEERPLFEAEQARARA